MNRNLSSSTSHHSPSNPLPLLAAITSFVNYKTAQGRGDHFAVARLPFPVNPAFPRIILDHHLEQLIKQAYLLPGLKAFMQHTTRHLKPSSINRFPLAPSLQSGEREFHLFPGKN
jgi:hypothetical protein